jgi:hypothetical protein
MDHDEEPPVTYAKVSALEIEFDEEDEGSSALQKTQLRVDDHSDCFLLKTLLPDQAFSIRNHPIVEGIFTVKLLKFIALTIISITLMHLLVANVELLGDRDQNLQLWHIWRYEGNLIVFDTIVFFLVGRLWKQRGVDHVAWVVPMLLCNVYFESQHFIFWLRHSVTLYEMHCVWPWQLWAFVAVLVPSIGALVLSHVWRAYQKRILILKIMEIGICAFFFLVPMVGSAYFHLHHWYVIPFMLTRKQLSSISQPDVSLLVSFLLIQVCWLVVGHALQL